VHPGIDPRYLFLHLGYNMRPTEISAALGLLQLKRLDEFVHKREQVAHNWADVLSDLPVAVQQAKPGMKHSWFAYPITVDKGRDALQAHLEVNGVETRSVMSGNIVNQPVMQPFQYYKVGHLPNADTIARNSLLLPCHQDVTREQQERVAMFIKEFALEKAT
jgi:CDP-6-deoxy-D-xylo-4-hexulose-3-dehydrase